VAEHLPSKLKVLNSATSITKKKKKKESDKDEATGGLRAGRKTASAQRSLFPGS
jgi:hypothetical protein